MQKIILIILIVISFNKNVFSKTVIAKNKNQNDFKNYICKQKNLPLGISYKIDNKFIELELIFQKEIKQFKIQDIRGIDGVTITDAPELKVKDVKSREKELIRIQYTRESGLGYLVLELVGLVRGIRKIQIISISIGELSQEQLNKRDENIVEIDSAVPSGPFNVSGEKKEKVHRIKLNE